MKAAGCLVTFEFSDGAEIITAPCASAPVERSILALAGAARALRFAADNLEMTQGERTRLTLAAERLEMLADPAWRDPAVLT